MLWAVEDSTCTYSSSVVVRPFADLGCDVKCRHILHQRMNAKLNNEEKLAAMKEALDEQKSKRDSIVEPLRCR